MCERNDDGTIWLCGHELARRAAGIYPPTPTTPHPLKEHPMTTPYTPTNGTPTDAQREAVLQHELALIQARHREWIGSVAARADAIADCFEAKAPVGTQLWRDADVAPNAAESHFFFEVLVPGADRVVFGAYYTCTPERSTQLLLDVRDGDEPVEALGALVLDDPTPELAAFALRAAMALAAVGQPLV